MARIAGLDLPKDKRIDIALSYIYGVGRPLAKVILANTTINPATRVKDLTEAEVNALNTLISRDLTVEGELRREVSTNIKRLIEIGSYRGVRHRRNLPSRGQRTKTNARTKRGKRKTVGATKAAAAQGKPEAKK
ncbi:MAG: 30S ribosomal protein S13 [Elusimicrobiota bacterium]